MRWGPNTNHLYTVQAKVEQIQMTIYDACVESVMLYEG